jgi:plastocyanin
MSVFSYPIVIALLVSLFILFNPGAFAQSGSIQIRNESFSTNEITEGGQIVIQGSLSNESNNLEQIMEIRLYAESSSQVATQDWIQSNSSPQGAFTISPGETRRYSYSVTTDNGGAYMLYTQAIDANGAVVAQSQGQIVTVTGDTTAFVEIVPGATTRTIDAYSPNPVTINVGNTVTWINNDSTPHTATSGTPTGGADGLFGGVAGSAGIILTPGQTMSHPFTEVGEFPYFCTLHPGMVGTVQVLSLPAPNEPPVAQDDVITTSRGTAFTIDVLANDSDPDGDSLVIVSLTNPANGSVINNQDGTVTYTPNPEFVGPDRFQYTVSDGQDTSSALVAVTVDSPLLLPVILYPTSESEVGDTFTVTGQVAQDAASVRVYIDENFVGPARLSSDGTWTLDVEDIGEGPHTLYATAIDESRNISENSPTVTFTVRNIIVTLDPPVITDPSSSLETDERALTVSGFLNLSENTSGLSIILVDGSGEILGQDAPDNEGFWSIRISDLEPKEYEIRAFAQDESGNRSVQSAPVNVTISSFPEWMIIIVVGGGATAAIAGAVLLHHNSIPKSKSPTKTKGNEPRDNPPSPSTRLEFRYGIENLKEILDNTSTQNAESLLFSKVREEPVAREIQEKLESTMGSSLQVIKKSLYAAKEAASIVEFCTSAGQDPDTFVSSVTDAGFMEMMKAISPVYSKLMIRNIKINSYLRGDPETGASGHKGSRQALFDINIEIAPIRPFIEAVLLVNEVRTKTVLVVFELNMHITVKKAGLLIKEGKREWHLENIRCTIEASVARISARLLGKTVPASISDLRLDKKIPLKKKVFQLKDVAVSEDMDDATSSDRTSLVTGHSGGLEPRTMVCPRCDASVEAINFCPECGLKLELAD